MEISVVEIGVTVLHVVLCSQYTLRSPYPTQLISTYKNLNDTYIRIYGEKGNVKIKIYSCVLGHTESRVLQYVGLVPVTEAHVVILTLHFHISSVVDLIHKRCISAFKN